MPARSALFLLALAALLACQPLFSAQPAQAVALSPPCEKPGWFPQDFGLKDHTVFWHDGYYYIASIYLPNEKQFAYARSADLCHWDPLTPILTERTPGGWDEHKIWAPHVFEESGIYYMYYTGVTAEFTQSILLATSSNPADPASWQPQGMLFQPDHPQSNWKEGEWSDCRDAMVMKTGEQYYLYYAASDYDGGIVGLATATSPTGPWTDWGSIIPPVAGIIPESPTIYYRLGYYYLIYHKPRLYEAYRIGASPAGPWSAEYALTPGWAHEVWDGQDGQVYTSYLTDYTITIRPITWNERFSPPLPFLGWQLFETYIPALLNNR